jgi:outer membrane protein OmpA-like peptidoglycan-associated protein
MRRIGFSLHAVSIWSLAFVALSQPAATSFPVTPGATLVIAVSNAPTASTAANAPATAQGDYEIVVTLGDATAQGVSQVAFLDAVDQAGVRRQVMIPRRVLGKDLDTSRLQVIGFRSSDSLSFGGTTALGPSRLVSRELTTAGRSMFAFRNFSDGPIISGTLVRDAKPVSFPVLLNGERIVLQAMRTTGMMSAGGATRPFEHIILDHPQHPISLRMAYGPRGGSFPFTADFAREVVRIDLPAGAERPMAAALAKNCRVEVPGIYFDFDQATIKPPSKPALDQIAAVIRAAPSRHVSIEGHTDSIGGAAYNDGLSTRRAAAVKAALARDYALRDANLSTLGHGARQPLETNTTLAGRARNRRVELVLDCAQRPRDR